MGGIPTAGAARDVAEAARINAMAADAVRQFAGAISAPRAVTPEMVREALAGPRWRGGSAVRFLHGAPAIIGGWEA